MTAERWVEVSPSQFAHEIEGLKLVRELLPKRGPFRAWSNFEFRDSQGNWSEVDLLLLAPDGFHLVELKYYSGRLRGNDQVWLRSGRPAEDSPLRLANRKAKRLRSKLMAAYDAWVRERHLQGKADSAKVMIPWIRESVFLHHPDFVCELQDQERKDLYGLPGNEARSGLPPVTKLFDGIPHPDRRISEEILVELMARIGMRSFQREAGNFVLDQEALEDGPGWQDWLGTHKHLKTRRRIRFRMAPEGSPEEVRRRNRQIASHEMRVMQHLSHDAVLRPEDFVDSDLGPGLVYPYDEAWQRLDLWLADKPQGISFETQLALIRQVGEALQYAHGKNVVHRGLNPHAVLIDEDRDHKLRVRIGDWQGVGRTDEATSTQATRGVTQLADVLAAEVPEAESWTVDGFRAPEGILVGASDRLPLDVFSLGALAFYIVTGGQAPARTRGDLIARLREQQGLDVSVELPEAAPALREAILNATKPRVPERSPDVAHFLAGLDNAVSRTTNEEITDPLEATAGAFLGGRFELLNRLGAGSTAVGLLVKDHLAEDKPERVLKVAIDDAAARRLEDEAEALRQLDTPRVVQLHEGPIDVGGRRALVLASAGKETLATHLGQRQRLSLDLLERWGTDLLETVEILDKAGVIHRDIKPANLGIREERNPVSDRAKHLVLFDFSLTKAAASDTRAGTPPYLDPFLGTRRQFDSAAERYAAAVVLFEMATGLPPQYGDGLSAPDSITDEATIEASRFDPSASALLTDFFTRALARDASKRHDTAAEMLREWRACFPASSVPPVNAEELAENATADTPLEESGLTPRAVSALEPLQIRTVGELALVDGVRLNTLAGLAMATKKELGARAKVWRKKFGNTTRTWQQVNARSQLKAPQDCAEILLAAVRRGTAKSDDKAVALLSRILGILGDVDANATQAELAAALKPAVTRARISQLLNTIQNRWASDPEALQLFAQLIGAVEQRLADLGGVATFGELAEHLQTLMTAGPVDESTADLRLVEGLLRCTIDRQAAQELVEESENSGWLQRRRKDRPMLVAFGQDLLEVAEALGHRADSLVAEANVSGPDALVPATRAAEQFARMLDNAAPARADSPYATLREGQRMAQLAARVSATAGCSAKGELHHRDMSQAAALRHTLPAVTPDYAYSPQELRDRVRSRFPSLPELPTLPKLREVVALAIPSLLWNEDSRDFRSADPTRQDITGLESRHVTNLPASPAIGPGAVGQRLMDSRRGNSFVALGVEAAVHDRLVGVLEHRFDARVLDLAHLVMDELHREAENLRLPWDVVLSADSEGPGSRGQQGLQALVRQAMPRVAETIHQTLADSAGTPVALVDASLLARYGGLGSLSELMDLSIPRPTAVWLLVPQVHGNIGPMVDGQSLPLTAPNQYVPVTRDWIDAHKPAQTPEGSSA